MEDLMAAQMAEHPCPICSTQAKRQVIGSETYMYYCPRCGTFAGASATWLKVETPEHMVRLSGWVREQNATGGNPPFITPETSRRVKASRLPRLRERTMRALKMIAEKWPSLDYSTPLKVIAEDLRFEGCTYSVNATEGMIILKILIDDGHLFGWENSVTKKVGEISLTTKGMLAAEALGMIASLSAQGFVAMWFDASLNDAWVNGFDAAIRAAGYAPLRIDNKEYIGGISDEVIAEIRRSRFVVVDYTGQRNNVYFEAGFALGLGLPVIPTCREDESAKLEFDIRHMNTLTWATPEDLAKRLSMRIQAVVGMGPNL